MNFHFVIDVRPFDFFKMSMKKTYRSPIGVCNILFFAAAVILTVRFFASASDAVQLLLIIMCLIFPVIQPLGVYFKAKTLSESIPKGLTLDVDNAGILVSLNEQQEKIDWKRVNVLIDNKDMLIIKVDGSRGYFLANRVLGDDRDAFKEFCRVRIG